jgi:serine carboxypeptidase-like clade 1
VRKLLSGWAFSPPLPVDDKLSGMTESAFRKEMDAWTLAAQSPCYIW